MHSNSSGRRKRRDPAVGAGAAKRLRMPHERDESPTGAPGSTKTPDHAQRIGQAHDDLERGLQDTDCRAQPAAAGSPCPSPAAVAVAPRSRLARRRRRARALVRA
jgi:hypothetical protein